MASRQVHEPVPRISSRQGGRASNLHLADDPFDPGSAGDGRLRHLHLKESGYAAMQLQHAIFVGAGEAADGVVGTGPQSGLRQRNDVFGTALLALLQITPIARWLWSPASDRKNPSIVRTWARFSVCVTSFRCPPLMIIPRPGGMT